MGSVTSQDLTDLAAYETVRGPIGDARIDLHFARLMALIANTNRDPRRRPEPFTVADFMPPWAQQAERPKSPHELAAIVANLRAAFGSKRKPEPAWKRGDDEQRHEPDGDARPRRQRIRQGDRGQRR